MRAEDRAAPVEPLARVLDVDVVDAIGELECELRRVEALVREVTRVEVDPERLAVVDRIERLARRDEVVGDLGRVHLEPEADSFRVEHVEDRAPALGEVLVAALDLREVVRRERVDEVPDRRAREAVDLRDAELRRGARRVLHPLGGARAHALRLAVAVDVGRQDRAVALVDAVADRLADEMRADRPHAETVRFEQLAAAARVAASASAWSTSKWSPQQASSSPSKPQRRAARGQVLERQIGPLAGEQRDGTRHQLSFGRWRTGTASPAAPSSDEAGS